LAVIAEAEASAYLRSSGGGKDSGGNKPEQIRG
jgi:hypothetical protein